MLKSLQKRGTFVFILSITALAIFGKVLGGLIGNHLVVYFFPTKPSFNSTNQIPHITFFDFLYTVIIAPPLETFLGQYLPIRIVEKFTKNDNVKIGVSASIFALIHLPVLGFLLGAFFVGIVYAWAYIVRRKQKKSDAFLVVAQSHALQNLISFLLVFFLNIKG
jgi:hypothetical protein